MSSSEWKGVCLGDIGKIVTGKTPSTKIKDNFGENYPFITPRDIKEQKNIIETERYLSEKGLKSVRNQVLDGISICVSCIGSDMGKVIIAKGKCVTNQQINAITSVKEEYNPDFIYYKLKPMKKYFHKIAEGSTMPIINKLKFSDIKIKVPELEEQKQIATILSSLDDKIELNNQINKNLEEISQAIFKHWFIDFEFPNENGEPYKYSGGEMVDSKLGAIPKGWKIIRLEDVVDEKKFSIVDGPFGTQLHAEEYQEIGIPVIRVTNLSFEGNFLRDSLVYITEEKFNHLIRSAVYPGDILLAKTGATIGKLARFPKSIKKGLIASSVMKISPNYKKFNEYYLFNIIKELSNRQYWESVSGGSTRPTINLADVKDVKLIYPFNKYIMKKYHEKVDYFYKLIEHNQEQNITLSKIRDILLPKLMSGEIRVPVNSKVLISKNN